MVAKIREPRSFRKPAHWQRCVSPGKCKYCPHKQRGPCKFCRSPEVTSARPGLHRAVFCRLRAGRLWPFWADDRRSPDPDDRWHVSVVKFGDHTLRCPLWCPPIAQERKSSCVHAQHPTTTDIAAPSGHSRPHPAYPPQNVITTTPVTDRQPSVLTRRLPSIGALVNVRPSTSTRRSSSW